MTMARFTMSGSYGMIPEGTYTFGIYDVTYDEEFGRMEVKMVTSKGLRYTERFMLKGDGDSVNEPAMNAFIYLARTAFGDCTGMEDFDEKELIGHYIKATVVHTVRPNRNDPSKTVTFANLGRDKEHMDGFEEAPVESVRQLMASAKPLTAADIDLDALLG